MQIDNALKNISQGEDNVRILTVEINWKVHNSTIK
jgi:hypothetical protein